MCVCVCGNSTDFHIKEINYFSSIFKVTSIV